MACATVASTSASKNIPMSSTALQQQRWRENRSGVSSLNIPSTLPSSKVSLLVGRHGDEKKPGGRIGRCCSSRSDYIAWDDAISWSNSSLVKQEHVHTVHESSVSSSTSKRPEDWLEESVVEIVRHLQEAPFLQLIYDNQGRLKTERQQVSYSCGAGTSERWNMLKDGLSTYQPDGVILVQRLDGNACEGHGDCIMLSQEQGYQVPQQLQAGGNHSTDMWGLLFLARTAACSACYILQTTRVCSSLGICTRFCVTKAQCFGPSVDKQIERLWLVSQ